MGYKNDSIPYGLKNLELFLDIVINLKFQHNTQIPAHLLNTKYQ